MKSVSGIRMSTPGADVAEGLFDNDGLLILASNVASASGHGVVFERKLSPDALVYAVFIRKGGFVTAMSARSDVCFSGSRCRDFRDTMQLHIGSREFTVKVLRSKPMASRRSIGLIVAATLIAIVLTVSISSMVDRWGQGERESNRVETVDEEEPSDGEDELISEVRGLVRAGKREQARLAVLERIEAGDGDEGVRRILEGLSKGRDGSWDEKRGIAFRKAGEARRLFEEGVSKMQGGSHEDAIRKFDESLSLVTEFELEAEFVTSLERARSDAVRAFKVEVVGALDALEREVRNSRKVGARLGTERLVRRYKPFGEVANLFAGDDEVERILKDSRKAIESSSRRWLAAVRAEAFHKGCEGALREYGAIARTVGSILPAVAAEARVEGVRCGEGGLKPSKL